VTRPHDESALGPAATGPPPEPTAVPPGGVQADGPRAVAVGRDAGNVVTGNGNRVANTIIEVHQAPHTAATPTAQEVAAAVATYAARVRQAYGRLDLEVLTPLTDDQPVAVELEEVFVAQAVRADPPPVELPRELLRRLVATGELTADDVVPPGVDDDAFRRVRESYLQRPSKDVREVLAAPSGSRVVLLGDPGAGKSTLAPISR